MCKPDFGHLQYTLLSIVHKTGWVCLNCRDTSRDKISELQTVQAVLTEQLSDVMVSLAYLQDEFNRLTSKQTLSPEPNDTEQAADKLPVTTTTTSVETTVLNTLNDIKHRQQNVIITGLIEPADTDEVGSDHSEKLFTELCEQHLPVKPLPLRGCSRRLGKKNANDPRPRRLLIKLKIEEEVQSVLAVAKTLRHSDDDYVRTSVYINADLTPTQAKLEYEKRKRRREARNNKMPPRSYRLRHRIIL